MNENRGYFVEIDEALESLQSGKVESGKRVMFVVKKKEGWKVVFEYEN